MSTPILSEVTAFVEQLYPRSTAQSWDKVGLVSGRAERPVGTILLAVDPTIAVLRQAVEVGADLVLTHHPLLLRGVHSIAPTTAKGAILTELVRRDIALYCAHTNADVAVDGVGDALAAAVGLDSSEPLQITEDQELGRVGDLPEQITLEQLADRLAGALPPAPVGIRVAGPPHGRVRRVAVLGGAGDHAFAQVKASGADVYITADLRHHPALEAREEAALTESGTPYLIDAGHYASEWLWLPVLAARLREQFAGVEVLVSDRRTDPWDFTVGTGPATQPPAAAGESGGSE